MPGQHIERDALESLKIVMVVGLRMDSNCFSALRCDSSAMIADFLGEKYAEEAKTRECFSASIPHGRAGFFLCHFYPHDIRSCRRINKLLFS